MASPAFTRYHVGATGVTAVNARRKPGVTSDRPARVRERGYNIKIYRTKKVGGHVWGQSSSFWYRLDLLAKGFAASDDSAGRVNPIPGHAVTTAWGKKPPYRNGRPLYWTTRRRHTGSDRAADAGTKILAVGAGVVHTRWDPVLGNVTLLYTHDRQGRKVTFWYCHQSKRLARDGAKVKKGQAIGRVGATGTGARGPHLHLEVRLGWTTSWAGQDYNPELYF